MRTLAEVSERSGFRVHAFVLMSNHYHLLLETPQANLSRGIGWLQNAFTRRINTRHRLAGTTFPEGDGRPELAVYSSLRRGWFFGSEEFREKHLGMLAKRSARIVKANDITKAILNG